MYSGKSFREEGFIFCKSLSSGRVTALAAFSFSEKSPAYARHRIDEIDTAGDVLKVF